MKQAQDPLTAAISKYLWPYLKEIGFKKVTARKFAREWQGVFQQLWVDANGVSGKSQTLVVLCANFPFGSVAGYMDPHGFRICQAKRWDTATQETAELSMQNIVGSLNSREIEKLDVISNIPAMLEALKKYPQRNWFETYSGLNHLWEARSEETLKIYEENKRKLKL
jgi:hypothetical protein